MLKNKLIYLLILLITCTTGAHTAGRAPAAPPAVHPWLDWMERAGRAEQARREQERVMLEAEEANLARQANAGDAAAQRRLAQIDRQMENLREAERAGLDLAHRAGGVALNMVQGGFDLVQNRQNAEINRRQAVATAAATQQVANRGALERLEHLTSKENIIKMSIAAAAVGGSLIAIYFAAKFGYSYAQRFLGMPKLARESSEKTLWQSFVSLFSSEEEAGDFMNNIVLAPEIDAIVRDLAKAALETKKDGIPYRNLFLFGEPGTGKTMIAKLIARHAGMKYVILSGADFGQFAEGEDVQQVHLLFERIKQDYKTNGIPYIILMDEVKTAAAPRDGSNPRREAVLDAILFHTGEPSEAFCVIATANTVKLDWAFMNRFPKIVHIPLPDINERVKMLLLYLNKYYVSQATVLDGEQAMIGSDITEENLRHIAQSLTGWSGRQLEALVRELRFILSSQHSRTVTTETFQMAANEKLKQDTERARYAAEEDAKATMIGNHKGSMIAARG